MGGSVDARTRRGARLAAIALMMCVASPLALAQSESDKQIDPYGTLLPDDAPSPPLVAGPFIEDLDIAQAQVDSLENKRLQSEFAADEPPEITKPPSWLINILEFIGDIFKFLGPLFKWILIGGAILVGAAIVLVIVREVLGFEIPFWRRKKTDDAIDIGYRPSETVARTLLEDADRLASEGRFDEAARLILTRSIQDIETERAVSLPQSLTSREISRIELIPGNARPAFTQIAQIVESAFFAGRGLDREGFSQARRAYEAFALPEVWQ